MEQASFSRGQILYLRILSVFFLSKEGSVYLGMSDWIVLQSTSIELFLILRIYANIWEMRQYHYAEYHGVVVLPRHMRLTFLIMLKTWS